MIVYARLRKVRRPAVVASPAGVGARLVVAVVVFLATVPEGTWFRAAVVLLAAVAEVADVLVALRAPVPVFVGLATVVPEDVLEALLFLRSC